MKDSFEIRLNKVLILIRKKIETYLELCESPIEKMFLINYFEIIFDSQTAKWFNFKPNNKIKTGPYFQYEENEEFGKFYPTGLRWYEINNIKIRLLVDPLEYELYPQYEIRDDLNKIKYRIDFALLYPRCDGNEDKIKVAIECDGHEFHERTKEQAKRDKEKDRFLQSKGWLVARFTGSEIYKKDIYQLLGEIDSMALNKDYELYKQTEKLNRNWELN